ncbi:ShlB/FhaC/HecB family hemolysin secretion/activation protein [uncultured Veillonella sp.]|uniref:ShlB/FhaC/HecB family hemolysin secretion/activation protein n=1 Tax=uncultured Veillonella sp. TaxID=159268 RepID=UPI0026182AF4|nr:ShlB/FhaC/HecB family hemolysin secretion/activation protein [uncultured Veillonella sp.]
MKKRELLFCLSLVCMVPIHIWGAKPIDTQEQLDRAREQQLAREARLGEGRITVQTGGIDFSSGSLTSQDGYTVPAQQPAHVEPSFFVSHIRFVEEPISQSAELTYSNMINTTMDQTTFVDNSSAASVRLIKGPLYYEAQKKKIQLDVPNEFTFLRKTIKPFVNRKLTVEDVNRLSTNLNTALIEHGYVTSRIGIPSQSLASGNLQFNLQLGRVESVLYKTYAQPLPWQNAFPIREGDILNIRNIEQGIEQMKRIGSQNVSVELEPGTKPLATNIVLETTKKPAIHGMISIDDSGLKDTGKLQWTATIGVDRVFNANDSLNLSINRDAAQDGERKGSRNHTISYSIPRGKDTFSISYSDMKYHQTINSMATPFISSSHAKTVRGSWNHVFHRDRTTKRSWDIIISKRNAKNYINDVEIAVQRANTASLEVGISERRYIKQNTLYSRVAIKQGVGWFGSQPEYGNGAPSTRFTQLLVDVDYQIPRIWGHRPASITTSFHGQWTLGDKRLFSRDMISLGNRYTVQGFDGENTLMAESGWYMRNEVASYIPKWKSSIYANIDFGAVYGPSTEVLTGKFIAGTSLGIRGQFKSGLFYDVFVGVPLYKPSGYKTDSVTAGFQAGVRF